MRVKAMLSRRSCLGRDSLGLAVLCLLASAVYPSMSRAQAPAFVIAPEHSSIKFHVKASVTIAGKFDKSDAALTFASPDETTGVLAGCWQSRQYCNEEVRVASY